MVISRALELGMTMSDLDNVDIAYIIEIAEQRNDDVTTDDGIEASSEVLDNFFR